MIAGADTLTLEKGPVRLEALRREHVPALLTAARESRETYGLTHVPADEPAMREYVELALKAREQGKAVPFATLWNGRVVGSTRFANLERWTWPDREGVEEDPNRIPDAVEIGWTWLAASAQRSPVNTHQKYLMLRFAFEDRKVYRVTLKTDRRNERSRKAMERIGAKLDGVLRSHMPAYDGGVRDSAMYSVTREEWPEVKANLERLMSPSTSGRGKGEG